MSPINPMVAYNAGLDGMSGLTEKKLRKKSLAT